MRKCASFPSRPAHVGADVSWAAWGNKQQAVPRRFHAKREAWEELLVWIRDNVPTKGMSAGYVQQWSLVTAMVIRDIKRVNDTEPDDDAPVPTASKPRRGRGGKAANSRTTSKKDSHWSWMDQIPATLALISKILRLKSHRIWTTTPDRDAFIK